MGVRKCKHRVVCNLYGKAKQALHAVDNFAVRHGQEAGKSIQALAPVATLAGGPTAGMVTAGLGKGLEVYSQVRREVGNGG